MTLRLRLFGRELIALEISPGEPESGEALDFTTTPVGFVQRGPHLTDGRYGCED